MEETDKAIIRKCYYCKGEGKLYSGTDLSTGHTVDIYENCHECAGTGERFEFF